MSDIARTQPDDDHLSVRNSSLEVSQGIITKMVGDAKALTLSVFNLQRFRSENTERVLLDAEAAVESAVGSGATRTSVPLRGLVPLVESASLVPDGAISDRYVHLLANAALGTGTEDIPSYNSILEAISPKDAQFLQYVFTQHVIRLRAEEERRPDRPKSKPLRMRRPTVNVRKMALTNQGSATAISGLHPVQCSWTGPELEASTENLIRLNLLGDYSRVEVSGRPVESEGVGYITLPEMRLYNPTREAVGVTPLGVSFSIAVNPNGLRLPWVELVDEE